MPTIKYIEHGGTVREVEAVAGETVMEVAMNNLVSGIVADCGGSRTCGTCHVYVGREWLDKVGQPCDEEQNLLEGVMDPADNSRLSCQIRISNDLDGAEFYLPASQY